MMEMMETQSTGAGSFADFDLSRVPSPCFVVDEVAVRRNLEVLRSLSVASDAKILLALKAFSMWSLAPLVSDYLAGTCASGLWEAQLARAHYGGTLTTYAPAFKPSEFEEIAQLSDHVVFNSLDQIARFSDTAIAQNADIGLRVNPECPQGTIEKYDPCAVGSRLGQPIGQIDALPDSVSGLHMHTLCEQGFAPLQNTVAAITPFLEAQKGALNWLNLGGGHLITHPDYDRAGLTTLLADLRRDLDVELYLELGTSVAFDAGILVGEVLDVMQNDGAVAILDVSAGCHMPDVIEAPYRPALMGETTDTGDTDSVPVRLGGPGCLAGDVIGTYRFKDVPRAGQRLAFLDQAHYSMVKTSTFNGIKLPSLAIWNSQSDALRVVRDFTYGDFEGRLS